LRILWSSSTPECSSGYGLVTREIVRRLVRAGHYVRIGTKHPIQKWHTWEGVEVFDGTNIPLVVTMLQEERFDYIVTLWDIWTLQGKPAFPREKWIAYVPIDTYKISTDLASQALRAGWTIAMTRHGAQELNEKGMIPFFAPLGTDTKTFRVKPKGRAAFRNEFGFTDETFLVGSVGLNYGDDRKGFITLMQAFKTFAASRPNARLYLHTHAKGEYSGTIDYLRAARNLGIDKLVCWPNQVANDIGRIDEEWLCDIYNAMDVFALVSHGEGFGFPLVEAQACGIPVIATATTSGPELIQGGQGKVGWLIPVDNDDLNYIVIDGWRHHPRPSAVLRCLETAYEAWQDRGGYRKIQKAARKHALEYNWDRIWETYWIPIVDAMSKRLTES
jgi:glycosyltransferase involved in cell wall biosynthesis